MFSLLRDSKVPPLSWLISLLVEGLPRVQELFILPSSLLQNTCSFYPTSPFLITHTLLTLHLSPQLSHAFGKEPDPHLLPSAPPQLCSLALCQLILTRGPQSPFLDKGTNSIAVLFPANLEPQLQS